MTEDKAITLAEIIQTKVQELEIPYEGSPIKPQVTLSIGIVSFVPTAEDDLPIWQRSVDMALEMAQEDGGDRYHVAE